MMRGAIHSKLAVMAALSLVLVGVSTPTLKSIRRRSLLVNALTNLDRIEAAKIQFAKENHRPKFYAVYDDKDLVPRYLPFWPTTPPDHATYAANSIGVDATVNGQTREQMIHHCDRDDPDCLF
jgi:hypothetical protein